MTSEAQKQATAKWQKENVKRIQLKLYPKDADLAEWLDSQDNRNAYIVELIRKDMQRHNTAVAFFGKDLAPCFR